MASDTTHTNHPTNLGINPGSHHGSHNKQGNHFFDTLAGKPMLLIGILLALIGAAAGVIGFLNQKDARAQAANNALYLAQKSLDTEMKAFAASVAPPPAAVEKDKKAPAAQPEGAESVLFKKTDVDAKFPEAVKKLQRVTDQYSGTRAAFEAQLALGSLYNNHGEPAKAAPWFEKAANMAPLPMDRAFALSSLGYAQEGAGKNAEAIQSFQAASVQGEAGKSDLLISVARNQEILGDRAKARATYDQIISQFPNSEQARSAELLKAQLGKE